LLEERCSVSRDLTTRSVILYVFVITVLNSLSAQNEYAGLSCYICKLAVCTMEFIVFTLRKTGLQKKHVFGNPIKVRSYDGQIGPECQSG